MSRKSGISTNKIALCGLLVALMLVLGYVESMIPVTTAVPGIKLGLSNGVLIFALYMLGIPLSILLMVLKVVLSGLLFGGVSAMMYSLAGGVVSLLLMILLKQIKGISPITVSMVGGVGHNVGQVGMSMLILPTIASKLVYYMAVLMLIGLGMGFVTGIAANAVIKHMGALKHAK